MTGRTRVAVVSTPRSGNTWLRQLLSEILQLAPHAVHNPADLDWEALPERAIVQLHWHPTSDFRLLLERYGFQVVTIYRHPLDVLISVLQFSPWEPQTARWLEGEAGDEGSILTAMPRSEAFRRYAASKRARSLLAVSDEWAWVPGTHAVRYEDLVADPVATLSAVVTALGERPERSIAAVVEAHSLDGMRSMTNRPKHFWRGSPGTWRSLLDRRTVRGIVDGLPRFRTYASYSYKPDRRLRPADADANWLAAVGPGIAAALAATA